VFATDNCVSLTQLTRADVIICRCMTSRRCRAVANDDHDDDDDDDDDDGDGLNCSCLMFRLLVFLNRRSVRVE